MILSKKRVDALRRCYRPGISSEDLADAAECKLWEAQWFVARRKEAQQAKALHENGLSTRKIAAELAVSQSFASRALRGWYD